MLRVKNPFNWFGPLFRIELLRLTRRGLHYRLRLGLGMLLLATLFAFYYSWFPSNDPMSLLLDDDVQLSPNSVSRFVESSVALLLVMQLGIVVLLTPFLAAGSITDEFEKRTLPLLMASPLDAGEIILSKLAARLAYVLGILFMFLPAMALMQLWGGVDIWQMLCGYVVIVFTMLSLGGLSVYDGVLNRSLGRALMEVYAIYLFFGPFSLLMMVVFFTSDPTDPWPLGLLTAFILGHLLVSFLFVRAAVRRFRREVLRRAREKPRNGLASLPAFEGTAVNKRRSRPQPGESAESDVASPPPADAVASAVPAVKKRRRRPPPEPAESEAAPRPPVDEGNPLLWKEMNFPRTTDVLGLSRMTVEEVVNSWHRLFQWIGLLALGIAVAVMVFQSAFRIDPLLFVAELICLFWWSLTPALRNAACVSREREQQTLEALFMLPVSRMEILRAKRQSGQVCGRLFGIGLFLIVLGGGCISTISLVVSPGAVIFAIVVRSCSAALGLWLSTVCRTKLRATIWLISILTGLSLLPLLLGVLAGAVIGFWDAAAAQATNEFLFDMNPISCWSSLTSRLLEGRNSNPLTKLLSAGASILVLLALSWFFWRDACRRFEQEGRD